MPRRLKRFLLRYQPPGIGLECTGDDGVTAVEHKDLPPANVVQSAEDISSLVDQLIAQDELLTVKRHKPALLTLLARLYQIDAAASEEDFDAGPPAKASQEPSLLQEGSTVVCIGLKGDLAVHNGEIGRLLKIKPDKNRCEVQVGDVEVKLKSLEHIAPVIRASPMAVGAAVVIRGLRNHTELNGCLGRVVECHEENHRYEVRATESGQLFRVKQENLVPIDVSGMAGAAAQGMKEPTPRKDKAGGAAHDGSGEEEAGDDIPTGSQVEVHGLKTAMAYNGQNAEVLSVDKVRCRYEIRLGDGSVKTIRAENVRLISRPSKTSPRRRGKEGGPKAADRGK